MNLDTALTKLFSMKQMGAKLGLENIQKLLKHLGNPEKKLKAFHVAGSNGKGSTSSFMASILYESGYKTGLYTSPHLVKFNERIKINGIEIEDSYIAQYIAELSDYIDKEEPTFFEITTALAFKYFEENNVDYCVIETGLGGRLDATNTLDPIASVITSISLEHTRILGDTLAKIAYEKAGIIKNTRPVFLGKLPAEAIEKIKEIAESRQSEVFNSPDFTSFTGEQFLLHFASLHMNLYSLPLTGKFQFYNASVAAITLHHTLGIKSDTILDGLKNVLFNTGLKGRFEVYNQSPLVLFDSAHNEEGITAFLEAFECYPGKGKNSSLIFGAMADKNLDAIVKLLTDKFDKYYVTTIDYERAASIEVLVSVFRENGITAEPVQNPASFINEFISKTDDKSLVVLGSIYVLGKVKETLGG